MENASKALIIAGAILISILIVGLGVIIYQNVAGIAKTGTLDAQEITAHNSPFEGYFGDYVSGSNVKALLTQVQANNSAANRNDEVIGNYIYVVDGDGATITSSSIKTGKMYYVRLPQADNPETYTDEEKAGSSYWSNGFLKTIEIVENTGNNSGSNS